MGAAVWFEIWNGETNNLSQEFASEDAALAEIRRRVRVYGARAVRPFAIVALDGEGETVSVIEGNALLERARDLAPAGD